MGFPTYSDIALEFTHRGLRTRSTGYTTFDILTSDVGDTGICWEVEVFPDRSRRPSVTDPTQVQCVSVRYCNGEVPDDDDLADTDPLDDGDLPVDVDSWVYLPYLPLRSRITTHDIFEAALGAVELRNNTLSGAEPVWDEILEGRRIARIWRNGRVDGDRHSGVRACETAPHRLYDLSYDPFRPEEEDTFVYLDDANRRFYRQVFDGEENFGSGGRPAGAWSVLGDNALTAEELQYLAHRQGQRSGYRAGYEKGVSDTAGKGAEKWARMHDLWEDLAGLDLMKDLTRLDDILRGIGDRIDDRLDERMDDEPEY